MTVVVAAVLLFASSLGSDTPASAEPVVEAPVAEVLTPRGYLFSAYPALARRMSCVIERESRWLPDAQNPRSGAAGLTQILLSTWLTTPQGKRGESRFNPFSNLDGAAWLVTDGGGWRHWAATVGGC